MDLLKNVEVIKNNKDVVIAAMDAYLDTALNILEHVSDEEGNLIEEKVNLLEEESRKFVTGLHGDIKNYDETRIKIKTDKFNQLEFSDICYVIASMQYCSIAAEKSINNQIKAKLALDAIIKDLASQKVDN